MTTERVHLENPHMLFLFLDAANTAFSRDLGTALLLPAWCPDECVVGGQGAWLYEARTPRPEDLHSEFVHAAVPRLWGTAYDVATDGSRWTFDVFASGSLRSRIHPVAKGVKSKRLRQALDAAAAVVDFIRAEVAARRSDAPAWERCGICHPVQPPREDGEPVQPSSMFFEIVGAPHFNDHESRGWCLKRCPACGTLYKWESDYEYLVGGSETSLSITRLGDEDGQALLAKVRAIVAAKEKG